MDFGRESGREDVAEQLVFDYRQADLSDADRALCGYAAKLTLAPADMTGRDVDGLRRHGLTDEQVTIAVQVIAYFNYINRIADGLGVEPEDWMRLKEEDWRRRKGRDYLISPAGGGERTSNTTN